MYRRCRSSCLCVQRSQKPILLNDQGSKVSIHSRKNDFTFFSQTKKFQFFFFRYDNDRVQQYALDTKDCGMKISSVEEDDNGEWECSVTGKGAASGNLEEGKGFINVVVALPPSQLYLEQDGNPLTGPVDLNLDSQRQSFIDCVAVGGRPSPSFNWYIGDQKMNANIEPSEETDENGVILYKSQLEYNADPEHNAQNLRCEVIHMGYTTQQLSDSQNIVSAPLNLQCKLPSHSVEITTA